MRNACAHSSNFIWDEILGLPKTYEIRLDATVAVNTNYYNLRQSHLAIPQRLGQLARGTRHIMSKLRLQSRSSQVKKSRSWS